LKPVSRSARQYLRDGTHAEHVRLNQHPLLNGITRSSYALTSYQQVLQAYFYFYRDIEAAIDRALAAGLSRFAYEARRKLPWIVSDLACFGIDARRLEGRPEALRGGLDFATEAELMGALYAIEGSTMGGQVISSALAVHLGLTPATGARFFHAYGEQTMPLWQDFETFMNAVVDHDNERLRALAAAKSIFAMMESVLDEYFVRIQPPSSP